MKVLTLITLLSLSTQAVETFNIRSTDSVCGFNASVQQEEALLEVAFERLEKQCRAEGFEGLRVDEVSFSTVPFGWGTIGCTPISSLTVSGIKECF